MTHNLKETVSIGWCDNGMVDGMFMDSVLSILLDAKKMNINITGKIRVNGNQIGRQRQALFDYWADFSKTDWLLWVDSDIVLNQEALKLVWDSANKDNKPVVSGVYFVTTENEKTLMEPYPAIFFEGETKHSLKTIHPLPQDKLIKIDSAGFGFLLMHKSIVPKLRKLYKDYSLFAEEEGIGDKYISEDIVFFRKLKASGVDFYAHTGATVQHIKRFSFDRNYYNVYWNALEKELFIKK
jgi:hypothetical protein